MPVDPIEHYHCGLEGCGNDPTCVPERRRRVRTSVQWPLTLFRRGSPEPIESTTRNLCSGGFYCLVGRELVVGDRLTALLRIPAFDPSGREGTCTLACQVHVLRIAPTDHQGVFGLACGIDDYHLAHTERLDIPPSPE